MHCYSINRGQWLKMLFQSGWFMNCFSHLTSSQNASKLTTTMVTCNKKVKNCAKLRTTKMSSFTFWGYWLGFSVKWTLAKSVLRFSKVAQLRENQNLTLRKFVFVFCATEQSQNLSLVKSILIFSELSDKIRLLKSAKPTLPKFTLQKIPAYDLFDGF